MIKAALGFDLYQAKEKVVQKYAVHLASILWECSGTSLMWTPWGPG